MRREHDLIEELGLRSTSDDDKMSEITGVACESNIFNESDVTDESGISERENVIDMSGAFDKSDKSDISDALDIDVEKIKAMVNDNLNSDPLERKIYMKKKVFSSVLAAALIMSITSATAFAATSVWNDKLVKYFNPTQQQMENMQNAVDAPLVSATNNGYTVDVLQTIVDKHSIYVLYDVTAPEGVTLSDDLQWKGSLIGYASQADDERGVIALGNSKILDITGNKMTVLMWEDTGADIIKNQEISLYLEDMVNYTENGDEITENVVGKCSFDLSWMLNYEDSTKTIEVNKKLNLADGIDNTLEKIEISPMAVWMFIESSNGGGLAEMPVVNFKDGTKQEFDAENTSNMVYAFANYQDRAGGVISLAYRFDKITDFSEIESITVGDTVIPISK